MKDALMRVVEAELAAFRERGGDDLRAVYRGPEDGCDADVTLYRRSDDREHRVSVQVGRSDVNANAWITQTKTYHGIEHEALYAMAHGEVCRNTQPGLKKFAASLSKMLDEHKGKFLPARENGKAVDLKAPEVIGKIAEGLPSDGALTIFCDTEIEPGKDCDFFGFVGPEGDTGFRVRIADQYVITSDRDGDLEMFESRHGYSGLTEAIANRFASAPQPRR